MKDDRPNHATQMAEVHFLDLFILRKIDNQYYFCCRVFLGKFDCSALTKLETRTIGFFELDDNLAVIG